MRGLLQDVRGDDSIARSSLLQGRWGIPALGPPALEADADIVDGFHQAIEAFLDAVAGG